MGVIHYKGRTPIPEIGIQRTIDISASDFDGSDTPNITSANKLANSNGSYSNVWADGFLIQSASGDGTVKAICYADFIANGKSTTGLTAQDIMVFEGQYSNVRVIKLISTGSTVTSLNIGV